jgi:hypothetical protein
MTYNSIGKIATSAGMNKRISAAAAQEGAEGNAQMFTMNNIWQIAASPGWAEAWESAEQTSSDNNNPDIGARNDVITDGMIIAAVQPILNPPPPEVEPA